MTTSNSCIGRVLILVAAGTMWYIGSYSISDVMQLSTRVKDTAWHPPKYRSNMAKTTYTSPQTTTQKQLDKTAKINILKTNSSKNRLLDTLTIVKPTAMNVTNHSTLHIAPNVSAATRPSNSSIDNRSPVVSNTDFIADKILANTLSAYVTSEDKHITMDISTPYLNRTYTPNITFDMKFQRANNVTGVISTDISKFTDDYKAAHALHAINQSKIPDKIHLYEDSHHNNSINSKQQGKFCEPNLTKCLKDKNVPFNYKTENTTFDTIIKENPELALGGSWAPKGCISKWRVALIIPVCDREMHLRIFVRNIVPFLMIQNIAFTIFAVEQLGNELFNKAQTMNAGFVESQALGNYNCFIFHDVDMIPVNLCNSYECSESAVKHLGLSRNLTHPQMIYGAGLTGASAFSKNQFTQINGFTNQMFGWGQEDDDAYQRVKAEKIQLWRDSVTVGNYAPLPHNRGSRFPKSFRGYSGTDHFRYRKFDGLNSLYYKLHTIQQEPALTRIQITMPGPKTVDQAKKLYQNKRLQYELLLKKDS